MAIADFAFQDAVDDQERRERERRRDAVDALGGGQRGEVWVNGVRVGGPPPVPDAPLRPVGTPSLGDQEEAFLRAVRLSLGPVGVALARGLVQCQHGPSYPDLLEWWQEAQELEQQTGNRAVTHADALDLEARLRAFSQEFNGHVLGVFDASRQEAAQGEPRRGSVPGRQASTRADAGFREKPDGDTTPLRPGPVSAGRAGRAAQLAARERARAAQRARREAKRAAAATVTEGKA